MFFFPFLQYIQREKTIFEDYRLTCEVFFLLVILFAFIV